MIKNWFPSIKKNWFPRKSCPEMDKINTITKFKCKKKKFFCGDGVHKKFTK